MSSTIEFVVDTFDTNPAASRAVLEKIFWSERFTAHAAQDVPALARKIHRISSVDPSFAADIYEAVYKNQVTSTEPLQMGPSRIVSLTTTGRQEFESARYSLQEHLPAFFATSPTEATRACIAAISGFVLRTHPRAEDSVVKQFSSGMQEVCLRPDNSYIWASELREQHPQDGDAVLQRLLDHLEAAPVEDALASAAEIVKSADLGVIWSRLFAAAASRGGPLRDFVLPFAMMAPFVLCNDTRKDAIDLIASGYDGVEEGKQRAFEAAILNADYGIFANPEGGRRSVLRALFGSLGITELKTDEAKAAIADLDGDGELNERLFRSGISRHVPSDFYWLSPEEREAPDTKRLLEVVKAIRDAFEGAGDGRPLIALPAIIDRLTELRRMLDPHVVYNVDVRDNAEGVFSEGVHKLINSELINAESDPSLISSIVSWIIFGSNATGPRVSEGTEAEFETGPGWGSPSSRIEAAEAALDLLLKVPEQYAEVEAVIDRTLVDPHPAVRGLTVQRLLRIWEIDRPGFWRRLRDRIEKETNTGVIGQFILSTLVHVASEAPDQVLAIILDLLPHYGAKEKERRGIYSNLVIFTLQFWLHQNLKPAEDKVRGWVCDAVNNDFEVMEVISWLRGSITAGLRGEADTSGLRQLGKGMLADIAGQAGTALSQLGPWEALHGEQLETARKATKLVDAIGQQIYYASGALNAGNADAKNKALSIGDKGVLLREYQDILRVVASYGSPQIIYHLVQLLDYLFEADPNQVFELLSVALLQGGKRSGFQFENMGADQCVAIVGHLLADHRELFATAENASRLTDILDLFASAGWASATRLLYSLPDLLN